jgi:Apea-like HEPN
MIPDCWYSQQRQYPNSSILYRVLRLEKRLAYQLVHLALADSNPETRHIQLVTAIEVLFKKQNRPKPILDALKVLLAEVKKWPDSQNDVKTRMAQILNSNKEESINRAGREQVAAMLTGKYTDKSAAAFFEHVYDMRSGLVHREKPKKPRPKIEDIREVQSELLRFVLDLLDAYDSD